MRVIELVVLGLIVMVVGCVIIPAVAKVREAANRVHCTNNMRQIGLSLSNYHDTFGYFPPCGKPKTSLTTEHRLSWIYLVVPFVEASSFYKEFTSEKAWDSDENRFAALNPYFICQCPSYRDRPPDSKFIPTHYLGISGIGRDAATFPLEHPDAGFFGYERKIRQKDIKNGLSNTLAVVETAWGTGAWTAAPDSIRGLDPAGSPYLGVPKHFGGNHPKGANVLLADGSVRFLDSSLDPQGFEGMSRIAAGQGGDSEP
jgi:prepilin-type processing-associated H-X9-DG protein